MSEWVTRFINENLPIDLKKNLEKGLEKGREEGWAEDYAEGWAEGYVEGVLSACSTMVRKNLISAKVAAEQLNMTELDFCQRVGITVR